MLDGEANGLTGIGDSGCHVPDLFGFSIAST
jgi:hypothetical protein